MVYVRTDEMITLRDVRANLLILILYMLRDCETGAVSDTTISGLPEIILAGVPQFFGKERLIVASAEPSCGLLRPGSPVSCAYYIHVRVVLRCRLQSTRE